MGKSIAIANQKGGVGKSTSAVTLAHGLSMKGKRVLIIDCDPQGQCAVLLGMQQEPGLFNLLISELNPDQVIRQTGRDGLDIIPGDKKTAAAQVVLSAQRAPISYIQDAIKPIQNKYDYFIFDTAPSVGDLMAAALWASDFVLIPSAVDFLSSDGVIKLMDTLRTIQKDHGWGGKLLGILPTFYDETTKESQAILNELNQKFSVLDPIHRATIMRECAAYGQTIFETDKNSRSAKEYNQLIKRVLEVVK
jgi:chromosome partitioning protein